ncbi:MAG TPA: zinc ribbon domain-containing protein [Clostridia bacterium]|nr:zinc ribbon domain-containing protein [Clostridia bacterium]
MKCESCGYELDGDFEFCQNCGQELSKCEMCKTYIPKDKKLCTRCGSELKEKLNKSKRNLKIASVATVVLYLIAVIGFAVFWGFTALVDYPNLVVYNKDGLVHIANFDLTRASKEDALIKPVNTRISQDGSKFFYINENVNSLMYVELPALRKGGVVDDSVKEFKISKTGDLVYYVKLSPHERKLYKSDLTSPELIAEGVVDFKISPDGSKLLYTTEDEVFYYKDDNLEFSSAYDTNHPLYFDVELDCICFVLDGKLNTYKDGAVVEVYDGVKKMVSCLQDGRLYFHNKANSLCYYDLKEVKVLNLYYSSLLYAGTKEPVVIVDSANDATVVHGDRTITLSINSTPVKASASGKKVYVLSWDGHLYSRDLEEGRWEVYDTNVDDFGLSAKGDILTSKRVQYQYFGLYFNRKLINESVEKSLVFSDMEGNIIFQTTGDEKVLCLIIDGETQIVTINFENYYYYGPERIYYLKRTPGSSYTDLYMYDGVYEYIMDDKVYSFVPVREETYGYCEEESYSLNGFEIFRVFEYEKR